MSGGYLWIHYADIENNFGTDQINLTNFTKIVLKNEVADKIKTVTGIKNYEAI